MIAKPKPLMTFSPDILWMSFNPLVGSCLVSHESNQNSSPLILESFRR